MSMRLTLQTLVANSLAYTQTQSQTLSRLQLEIATGNKVNTPSDDPVAFQQIESGNAQDTRLQSYLSNIGIAQHSLDLSVSSLNSVSSLLSQAKALALQASSSTEDANSRGAIANQIDGIINSVLSIANTQSNGDYIFGGTSPQTQPFAVTQTNNQGGAAQITYKGGTGTPTYIVGPNQTANLYSNGQAIFQPQQRQATLISGSTGAAPGTAVDSATGIGSLLVTHTATTYAGASGVQAGTSSAAGDTILGPSGAHHLTINDTSGNGSGGTISLDGGPAIAFTSTDTNLKVTAANGQLAYVDTTAITAGFNGSVNIAADGALSIDGGATSTPIDFSANQQLLDSHTGTVTNVDSSKITKTGTDTVTYQGTSDVFQVLIQLRDELRNTTGVPEKQQLQAINNQVAELQRVNDNTLNAVGQQSSILQNLATLQQHTTDLQLSIKQTVSNLQQADPTQVIVQFQAQQIFYQLTLATIPKMFDQNLLNYLK